MGMSVLAGAPSPGFRGGALGPGIPLWGPFDVHPHLLYSLTYGNGIRAAAGEKSTTAINTVAPGFLLDLGQHWTLDYSPSLGFYSNPLFRDTTDQSVLLRGGTSNRDWVLALSQSYVDTTQPLVETGRQTEQEAYATAINVVYQMGSKVSLELGLNQIFRFAQDYPDLHAWTTADWLNYQIEPQLGVAIGLTLGYDELSVGSDMPFEQALGRIVFHPGPRLILSLMGGAEDRQFTGPSEPPLISPLFTASLQYQVFQPTVLSLAASRTVVPSLFANEVEEVTTINGSIRQQLSPKFSLHLTGSYTTTPFTSIEPGPLPSTFFGAPTRTALEEVRNDTTTSATVSLLYTVTPRVTITVFFTTSENSSGQASYKYSSAQEGFSLRYRF